MTYGNGVRDDTQQLRDIQDLIAKLDDVNKKLALPARAVAMPAPAPAPAETDQADAPAS
jgi:ribosomal protein L12E/L44/L45/RPP1/RPP2